MNFSPQESGLRSRYFLASCDGKTTPDLDALDSVTHSSPLHVPPREESSEEERRHLSRTAAGKQTFARSQAKEKATSARQQGEVVIDLISSRQETGARHERSAWVFLCYFIVSFTSDYKMLFKFTIELRVIELLRLTTMKIRSNVVPPFRNSQSRQTGQIVELRESIRQFL